MKKSVKMLVLTLVLCSATVVFADDGNIPIGGKACTPDVTCPPPPSRLLLNTEPVVNTTSTQEVSSELVSSFKTAAIYLETFLF